MSKVIYLAEPDADLRDRLKVTIEAELEIEVRCFHDPGQVLRALVAGDSPDLVITSQEASVSVHPITGSDLSRAIKAIHGARGGPPVVLTANTTEGLDNAARAGAAALFFKPLKDAPLLARLHVLFAEQNLTRDERRSAPRYLTAKGFVEACRSRSLTVDGGWLYGDYLILSEVGRGAIGIVTKSLRRRDLSLAALKLLKPEQGADDEGFSRFCREGRNMQALDHPNLVAKRHTASEAGIAFIDMDFVDGRPLRQIIDLDGAFEPDRAIDILAQVCRGLAALDALGLIHRDIKPENIMVDRYDNARLIDYGLTKRIDDRALTQDGEILGTLAFIAPELINGHDPDCLSDIYALGITLLEMLTGGLICGTSNTRQVFIDTLSGSMGLEARESLAPGLRRIADRMTAIERSQRYQSAEHALGDLAESFPAAWARHRLP